MDIIQYDKMIKILYQRIKVDSIKFYRNVPAQYKKSLIYTRLGYEKTNTLIDPDRKKQIDKWITEAEALCRVDVVFRTVEISNTERDTIVLGNNEKITSSSLAALLRHSDEAVIMASTSGNRITDEIKRLQQAGEMAKALVYDAAASEITDAGLDWLMGFMQQQLMRLGKVLTHMRYSPGYGDLDLSNQDIFYRLLNLKEWGVEITDTCMLIPEKTVIAIVGIGSYK